MTKLQDALDLAARGFWVFPCREGAKGPAVSGWQEWATRDAQAITSWWTAHPETNIGVFAEKFGDAGALLIIDVDKKHGKDGDATLLQLELQGCEVPDTLEAVTPTGGRHIFLSTPTPLRNSAGRLGAGLDTRSAGGYVVGVGSEIGGAAYRWRNDRPVAPAPAWLAERLAAAKPRDDQRPSEAPVAVDAAAAEARARRYLAAPETPLAETGAASDTTYRVAARCKDLGCTREQTLALMLELWVPRCPHQFNGVDDVETRVRNAYAYGQNTPGSSAPEAEFAPVPEATEEVVPTPLSTGSDVEIARAVLDALRVEHGDIIAAEGSAWRYDGSRWVPFDHNELRRRVHGFDGKQPLNGGRVKLSRARIDSILAETLVMAEQSPDFFATAAPGINCQNGFIRFDAKGAPTLVAHSLEHRARHILDAQWKPGAEWRKPGSLLMRLLEGCFADDIDQARKIGLIAEIFGAAVSGSATRLTQPRAAVFYGQSAANGKSQLLDAARGLLPGSAIAALAPDRFGDDRLVLQLVGALLNASDELSGARAIASDRFKSVITGEPLVGRQLYQTAIQFRCNAMNVFATNTLPSFSGGFDNGLQRRLLLVTFNRTIPEAERIEHIGSRVATEEADLLLAFAVEGASRVIARRCFDEPPSSKAALRDWIFGSDAVLAWFAGCVELDAEARLLKQDAYRHFRSWARNEGYDEGRLPSINNFVARVKAQDQRISDDPNRKLGRRFIGLKLASNSAVDDGFPQVGPPALRLAA